jgi:hypothetical protein
MTIFLNVLCVIGGLYTFFYIILPILEALLFGILSTWLEILNVGWSSFKPKYWWWLIRIPWVKAFSRLFGFYRYTSSQNMGEWIHIPPFTLKRIKRGYKDNVEKYNMANR